MYVRTYVRTYVYTYTYTYVGIYIYVRTYICTYIYAYMYVHMYVRTYVRTYIGVSGFPNRVFFPWVRCWGGLSGIPCFSLLSPSPSPLGTGAPPPATHPFQVPPKSPRHTKCSINKTHPPRPIRSKFRVNRRDTRNSL